MSETPSPMPRERIVRPTAACLGGLLLWAAHFGLAYAFQHLACAAGGQYDTRPLLAVITAALALLSLALAAVPHRAIGGGVQGADLRSFLASVTRLGGLLSAAAIIWAGASGVFLSGCGGGR